MEYTLHSASCDFYLYNPVNTATSQYTTVDNIPVSYTHLTLPTKIGV